MSDEVRLEEERKKERKGLETVVGLDLVLRVC